MNLLANAGTVILWCTAGVIGVAVVAVAALYVWDKWTGWQWERRGRK